MPVPILLVTTMSALLLLGCDGGPLGQSFNADASADAGDILDADGDTPEVEHDADDEVDAGPPPFRVPDGPLEILPMGDSPAVIFRYRADGTSTSPGSLSEGVEIVTVERPVPFSAFRYGVFHGTPTASSPGFLGEAAIAAQTVGFTIQAWFRARSVEGLHTLFSNTGDSRGFALDLRDGILIASFSTSDAGEAVRHHISAEESPIVEDRWYHTSMSASRQSEHWRVAFFLDGHLVYEEQVSFDHGADLMNSTELPAVAAEPTRGALDMEGFDGDIHAVVVHNYPISDTILGAPLLREGGRYFGAPSYHDYLHSPEPVGTSGASPPYSDHRYNMARRIAQTDRDRRFPWLPQARVRLGLPFLNDRYVPTGLAFSADGETLWLGYHYQSDEGTNPDEKGSFIAQVDLPSYRVTEVFRLVDQEGADMVVPIGGIAQTEDSLYVTSAQRVHRFDLNGIELEEEPDPDLPDCPSFLRISLTESFEVRPADASLSYDRESHSLWLAEVEGVSLERYELNETGAIARPSSSSSDESIALPPTARSVRGAVPIASSEGQCFLVTVYEELNGLPTDSSRLYRFCEGDEHTRVRMGISSGAQAVAVSPDGTLWVLHQSGAAVHQKSRTTAQWYDVLTPYIMGYDPEALEPRLTECRTGEMSAYFGDMHSHTENSDGTGTPAALFEEAMVNVGLDFFIVTDHSSSFNQAIYETCAETAASITEAHDDFLGLCGFEFSINGSGTPYGHANIFFSEQLYPYPHDMDDFDNVLTSCDGCLGQIDHPSSERFPWLGAWSELRDRSVVTAELNGGTTEAALETYFELLDDGWHVAPAFNSDTHHFSPGSNNRRSGIFAPSLDEASLYDALQARRTFASSPENGAGLALFAEGCWMGARLLGHSRATFRAETTEVSSGWSTIELLSHDRELLHSFDCAGEPVCEGTVTIDVDEAAIDYVVAFATRSDGAWALSSPIWIE